MRAASRKWMLADGLGSRFAAWPARDFCITAQHAVLLLSSLIAVDGRHVEPERRAVLIDGL
jgi:hypothetical protein